MATKVKTKGDKTREEALVNLRSTLEWLGEEIHYIENPVDPVLEMCAITKAFDGSKALVANNITNYPDVRMISNLYATQERTAKLLGADEFKNTKFKILEAVDNSIPPRVVEEREAPCQEVVIPMDSFRNPAELIPIVQHTAQDGGRIFGAGVHFFGPPWVPGEGTQLAMYRMAFRDSQKFASINMVPGGQGDVICSRWKGHKIPCTVNICPPVGVELMAVGTLNPIIFPGQTDKIGMAGALQGSAVDLVKAKTVDAYAIAQSEWVLEGYVIEGERVWETDEAEQLGRQGVALLHPEWARTMGHSYRTPRAFELTAITRRADKPLCYTPHFGAFWYATPFICASVYEMCDRMAPGFVQDVATWMGLTSWGGMAVQVKKQKRSDEGLQRNVLGAIMTTHRGLRLCVIVDDDIDIWQPEDVVWAIESRVSPRKDIVVFNEYGRGQAFQPSEFKIGQISVADGGIGIDATVPMGEPAYERGRYPVDQMDFSRWFTQEEIDELHALQDPYFRYLGKTGYA